VQSLILEQYCLEPTLSGLSINGLSVAPLSAYGLDFPEKGG
jgi:hypothetical protein